MRPVEGLLDILTLYRARLRNRTVLVQEVFAALGLAVGVALLFASQISSTSLDQSVSQLTKQIVGRTNQLQIETRGPGGFSESLRGEVKRLPGVVSVLPMLEQPVSVIGPHGRRSVELLGADPHLARLGGPLIGRFSASQLAAMQVVALPEATAEAIGADGLQPIKVQVGAHVRDTLLGAVLHRGEVGALADTPVALTPIAYAQKLTGTVGKVSRLFVRVRRGQLGIAKRALARLAAAKHLNLEPAMFDAMMFAQASTPESEGELLFSAISALVGFMLALNALLITVPARRKMLDAVRLSGATRGMCIRILLLDAGALAASGTILGLALGDLLSIEVFKSTPGYLASAFPIGNDRIVAPQSILIASAAGMGAALIGVLWPLRDLLHAPRAGDAHHRKWSTSASWAARLLVGGSCLGATTAILLLAPQAAITGMVLLIVALALLLPILFDAAVFLLDLAQRPLLSASTKLAITELQTPGTRVRALAIAATGAVAVFGIVSIGGARSNLQRGLDASAHAIDSSADIWVTPAGQSSVLTTQAFKSVRARLSGIPGVREVGIYRGSFLDWGVRRLWIQAQPPQSQAPVPAGQITEGDLHAARLRVRSGGWAVLSEDLAHEHGLHVGEEFLLPAPHPVHLRVAALATNLGWPPGAIVMAAADYARAWASNDPSAYEIQTQPGASSQHVRNLVQRALSAYPGLRAETLHARLLRHYELISQGLGRLSQIRTLVLLAAILATVGAMGAMLWQRRPLVAWVKCQGYSRGVLWRWLSAECAAMLGVGCMIGALFGIYGQLLISHALVIVTGFPVDVHVATVIVIGSFALVSLVAVAVVSLAGYLVVRVPARTTSPAY